MENALQNPTQTRFEWVVNGELSGTDSLCDIPVLSNESALVIPTVGAIWPDWVLVVPRTPAISLAALIPRVRNRVFDLAKIAAEKLGNANEIVFFEHGPRTLGSAVGCGVDQAHLHVLRTKIDLISLVLEDDSVDWSETDLVDPWLSLDNTEYYFIRKNNCAFVGAPRIPQSQFFRKHIARAAGVPTQWDYTLWPNYENVRLTHERFRICETDTAIF